MLPTQRTVSVWVTGLSLAWCSIPNIACSEGQRNLGGTPTSIVNVPTLFPRGQEVTLGQPVRGTVRPTDPPCDTDPLTDAPNPCTHFTVATVEPGDVLISVRWNPQPDTWLMLWPLGGTFSGGDICGIVHAIGNRANFAVGLHAGNAPVGFDLTTSWAPDGYALPVPRCRN